MRAYGLRRLVGVFGDRDCTHLHRDSRFVEVEGWGHGLELLFIGDFLFYRFIIEGL